MYYRENLLKPDQCVQVDVLVGALTEILWKVCHWLLTAVMSQLSDCCQCGEKKHGVVAMPGSKTNISPSSLLLFDGVTEKVAALQSENNSPLTIRISDKFHALQL